MKNNNLKNRIIVFISCIALLFSLLSVNVFAADPVPPFNDFLDGQGFQNLVLTVDQVNMDTVNIIYEYYDLLFRYNMTNGMRLSCVSFENSSFYGGYIVKLYFASGSGYGKNNNASTIGMNFNRVVNANRNDPTVYLDFYDSEGSYSGVYYVLGSMTVVGNVASIYYNSAYTIEVKGPDIVYRNRYGDLNVWSNNYSVLADSGNVPDILAHNLDMLKSFVGSFGSQVVNSYDLDIGSIFTAMMTAGMSIFNGFFGFTLFGINIAGTLVSILVVAIVIFVVKWLLGGK